MIKRRKRGVILILIGVGIILLTFMFSTVDGWFASKYQQSDSIESLVEIFGFEFPKKYPLAIGGLIALIGIGMIILSFFPDEDKTKKREDT